MRAVVPDYNIEAPGSLQGVLELLAGEPGRFKPFAGGTEIMVFFNAGHQSHREYVNIWGLPELAGIEVTPDYVRLGALTTYTEIRNHGVIQKEFPTLCQSSAESGALAIQNRGTLGGNIANASPAADAPPPLIAYRAEIEVVSKKGKRRLDYRKFHRGYKQMDLAADELILAVYLPRVEGRTHYYRKVGPRKAQAISKVCLAATARLGAGKATGVGIGIGAVAPTVLALESVEQLLEGATLGQPLEQEIRALVEAAISPIDDIRSNETYRRRVAANLVVDFWQSLKES
ncbi:MAG: FAD binding domain-containing protein [Candidatus Eremiobacteraeota bacterium]|nr:FAD binding domain-containing protein [Candidatus Eremiobacteraeota bacterium]